MVYVTSDIHGCYYKYIEMLKQINFRDSDTLFVLGDILDRGTDGIKVLKDMMLRHNVFPIMGNHEYMAYHCIKELYKEISEENIDSFDAEKMTSLQEWMGYGGDKTIEVLKKYSKEDIDDILEYIEEFTLCEEIEIKDNRFILVHAGLDNFLPDKDISEYELHEVCFKMCDYDRRYFPDNTYIVTGHVPTFLIDESFRGKIYHRQNNIAIDCGAVYGEKLACLCLDNMKEYYV